MGVSDRVVLANGGMPLSIPASRVYFAFPSGRMGYECVACGAQCCRGHGYDVFVGRELQEHLAAGRQVLRFFLEPPDSGAEDHFHTRNLKPGCFFLTGENACSIQVQQGYDKKPETCRHFPFNQIHRLGDHLIVGPHTSLCPLGILPPGERSDASKHELLLAEFCAMGISTPVPEWSSAGMDVPALIALERRIVELSDGTVAFASYASHAAGQLALTRQSQRAAEPPDAVEARAHRDVETYRQFMYDVLGASPGERDDRNMALVRTMVGMTPSIRAQCLFAEGAAASATNLERVPLTLVALHALASFAGQAGMAPVSFQTVMMLLNEYRALLWMLTNIDRVMVWKHDAAIDFALTANKPRQAHYVAVAKALVRNVQRKTPVTLGRILCDLAIPDAMDRVVFLKLLASRLYGHLVPLDEWPASASRLRHPTASVQQWALEHLGSDALELFAEMRFKRSSGR